jgi:hypothetical protein
MTKLFVTFIFIFTFTNSLASTSCKSSNHWGRFYNGDTRDQGDLGSCHTFASATMLEAKFREIGYATQNFSEKDLFILHYIENAKKFVQSCDVKGAQDYKWLKEKLKSIEGENLWFNEKERKNTKACSAIMDNFEGGNIFKNLELIQKYGVCSDLKNYKYDIEKIKPLCNRIGSSAFQAFCSSTNIGSEDPVDHLTKRMNMITSKITETAYLENRKKNCRNSIERSKKVAQSIDVEFMGVDLKNRLNKKSRSEIKSHITGFLECGPVYASVGNYHKLLSGDSIPDDAAKHATGHAVIIAGYDCDKDEFIIRNSWGSKDDFGNYIPERVSAEDFIKSTSGYRTLVTKSKSSRTPCEKKLEKANNPLIKWTSRYDND